MPKPYKDPKLQNRIKRWIEKNPDRVYTARYEDIAVEARVSQSTLYRYFPLIAARALNKMPSEIVKERRERKGLSPWVRELTKDEVNEIVQLYNDGHSSLDVAFVTGRSLSQVEKFRPKDDDEEVDEAKERRKEIAAAHKRETEKST